MHKRALQVRKGFKSSLHQLLEKDNSVNIHQHNLQTLAIEIFKGHNNITPEIMKDLFEIKYHQYNYRKGVRLEHRNGNTVLSGTETIASVSAKIRNLVLLANLVQRNVLAVYATCTKPRAYINVNIY